MPDLTITNRTRSTLPTQSSFGRLDPGESKTQNLRVAEIEQMRTMLIRMEAKGLITWNVDGYSNTDPDAEFVTFEDVPASGPTGPASALRSSSFMVGNAPAGDVVEECDYLDPGDGTGLAAAIAAANASGAPGEVYIRRGIYDLGAGGTGGQFLGSNVQLRGEGKATEIRIGAQNRNFCTVFGNDCTIRDLKVSGPAPAAGAFGQYCIDLFVGNRVSLLNVTFDFTTSNGNESLQAFTGSQFGATNSTIQNVTAQCSGGWPVTFNAFDLYLINSSISQVRVAMLSGLAAFRIGGLFVTFSSCAGSAPAAFRTNFFGANGITLQGGSWQLNGTQNAAEFTFGVNILMTGVSLERVGGATGFTGAVVQFGTGNNISANNFFGWTTGIEVQPGTLNTLINANYLNVATPINDLGTGTVIGTNLP